MSKRSLQLWLKRRFLTAGEGEFLTLTPADIGDRLDRGRRAYKECLNLNPTGFVAPAWLFNDALRPALTERSFLWNEDHRRIHDLRGTTPLEAPVITWASRSRARRWGSIRLASRLLQHWQDTAVLRIAVHPFDFDHACLIESIRHTIATAMNDRALDTYENVLGADVN